MYVCMYASVCQLDRIIQCVCVCVRMCVYVCVVLCV